MKSKEELMLECWRRGFKANAIIEHFTNNGIYISEFDVEPLFRKVFEEYFKG